MPEVTFLSLTRRSEIGAHCYIIDTPGGRIALDAGMHPKEKGLESLPDYRLVDDNTIDAAVISHSHLDHVGSVPVLMRRHPGAEIFLSEVTGEIADAMLHNSVNVMGHQREQEGIKEYPLFTHREVDNGRRKWRTRQPGRAFELAETGVTAEFFEAGHLPGSVGVRLDTGHLRILYTGDVHFEDQTMMRAAEFPEEEVDVLIIECTRGAHERPADYTRAAEAKRLAESISRTIHRGGSVLMPVFAIGKTQEMLLLLHELRQSGLVPHKLPVHIGGLSTKMTQIVDQFSDRTLRRHSGFQILRSMDNLVQTKRGERITTSVPGRIYALSSGMMTENTVSNDFAYNFIHNPKNAVLFVGYADPISPAGQLIRTERGDKLKLHASYAPVEVQCDVECFDFSGHAPRHELVAYAAKVRPRKILLVHGDGPALDWMTNAMREALPDTEVIVPLPGEKVRLDG